MLLMMILISACGTRVSSPGAGCQVYFENSKGIIGADASKTPRGVKERVIVLDTAMKAAC